MTAEPGTSAPELATGDRRLAILLAAAMFVLVVDTSVMNVSIAAVVHDLHTTVSGVQSAIALEALVSAAFILIGSKVGDLIGRKRAYVLGLLVSQLNNLTLAPISEERVSEAAGVNSAGGSFGLSFGLAFAGAILLATLSFAFTNMAQSSTVLSPAEQQQVAKVLEHDAQVVSNTQLEKQLASQPPKTQDEIIRINTQARHLALQIALLIPILAALGGLLISFRMMRLPDPRQSGSGEGVVLA